MQYENVLALRVSLETGLRIGDVLKIKPCDLQGFTIKYTAEKTGKVGKKVLSADLANRLKRISGKHWIFAGRDPQKHRTRQAVFKDLKKACKECGINGNIAPHSARKTYAVELFHDSGINAVQRELQHDRVDTTMLYAFADVLNGGNNSRDFDFEEFAELIACKVVEKLTKVNTGA